MALAFVRIVFPIALVLAGALLIAFSGPIVVGVGMIVLAFFTLMTNVLVRLAISSQDDRELEARARERFSQTGSWSNH